MPYTGNQVYEAGSRARKIGLRPHNNPFRVVPRDLMLAVAWEDGFVDQDEVENARWVTVAAAERELCG